MIIEQEQEWSAYFQANWLKYYTDTGGINWKLYKYVKNKQAPAGPGIELSRARLLLISSAGAYLPARDKPFDAANLLGDYSIRTFPAETAVENLAFSHDHYDQSAVREDLQVLLPLNHLQEMVDQKIIGDLSETVISFMGYQPWASKILDQTIPSILELVQKAAVDAVLLVPS